MERKTVFSPCRRYRYCLWREWDSTKPSYAAFVGLNPSTADEFDDDPTVRRCVEFAKGWGYGAVCMLNLFAYWATAPKVLKAYPEPVGSDNDRWLVSTAANAAVVVAAWGNHGSHLGRDKVVIRLLAGQLSCLGRTKAGHPAHPLYLRKSILPIPYA